MTLPKRTVLSKLKELIFGPKEPVEQSEFSKRLIKRGTFNWNDYYPSIGILFIIVEFCIFLVIDLDFVIILALLITTICILSIIYNHFKIKAIKGIDSVKKIGLIVSENDPINSLNETEIYVESIEEINGKEIEVPAGRVFKITYNIGTKKKGKIFIISETYIEELFQDEFLAELIYRGFRILAKIPVSIFKFVKNVDDGPVIELRDRLP